MKNTKSEKEIIEKVFDALEDALQTFTEKSPQFCEKQEMSCFRKRNHKGYCVTIPLEK